MDETKPNEDFYQYLIDVMGLREGSAKSYLSYLAGVEKGIGKPADELVRTDEMMGAAIARLREEEPRKTVANQMSGLRAYYQFKNGRPFKGVCADAKMSECDKDERGDLPFEIRQQLNDLEIRMYDQQDAFWRQMFQLAVAVLTVIPSLVLGKELSLISKRLFVLSMIIGVVGLNLMFPLLRRPFRQTKEIYEHGRKIMAGEETRLEILPGLATRIELRNQFLSITMLLAALLILFIALGVSIA